MKLIRKTKHERALWRGERESFQADFIHQRLVNALDFKENFKQSPNEREREKNVYTMENEINFSIKGNMGEQINIFFCIRCRINSRDCKM